MTFWEGANPISIHAPRVGSDNTVAQYEMGRNISIHAPRVGSDRAGLEFARWIRDFNPRSPCGERLKSAVAGLRTVHFNPRSPCGERPATPTPEPSCSIFQSTLPVWGATWIAQNANRMGKISIHAPRVGSDQLRERSNHTHRHFNPRSPCGERRNKPRSSKDAA